MAIQFALRFLLSLLLVGVADAEQPVSGYAYLSPDTQEMQDDPFANPGMLAVDEGRGLFHEVRVDEPHACSQCHQQEGKGFDLKSLASYPKVDPNQGLVTLQGRIAQCWEYRLDRFPIDYDSRELLLLETYVRNLARGQTVQMPPSPGLDALLQEAEALYKTPFGQLAMSCQHCHVQHQGQMLRGQQLSQGQSNGFPEYRLGSGRITSLHQRMKECFISYRAEPFPAGSRELQLLELYLAARGQGLEIETPAIRY